MLPAGAINLMRSYTVQPRSWEFLWSIGAAYIECLFRCCQYLVWS